MYVFFLPMGSFFRFPGVFATVFTSFSTLFVLVGIFVIFTNSRKVLIPKRFKPFVGLYAFMLFYSVAAASVLSVILDVQYKSPFLCILGDVTLYFIALLSIYFNYYCLSYVVKFKDLYKIFNIQIVVSIFFGIFQIGALFGVGICLTIYNFLSGFMNIMSIDVLLLMERGITLFGAEPSALTQYLFFLVPFILIMLFKEKHNRIFYGTSLVLFILLFIASNSTQTILLLIVLFFSFMILSFSNKVLTFLRISAFITGLVMALFTAFGDRIEFDNKLSGEDGPGSLSYVVAGKIVDRNNLSTQMRASTIVNDMKIFQSLMGVGVGDGCQGFWYAENVPEWCLSSEEVSDIIAEKILPNGGGAFMPSYLSAYGFVGIFVLLAFVNRYRRFIDSSFLMKDKMALMIFNLASIIILVGCWYTITFRESAISMFILSLPLCTSHKILTKS